MSDTRDDPALQVYNAFVTRMNEIIGANFSPEVPNETKRSAGLDDQAGLIVGAITDKNALRDLRVAMSGLPNAWSVYNWSHVHCTFGAYEDLDVTGITDKLDQDFDRLKQSVQRFVNSNAFTELMLVDLELRVSADTLILSAKPNRSTFEARQGLLAAADTDYQKIRAGGWGSHLTLARLKRPLSPNERTATNNWIREVRVLRTVRVTEFLVGAFTVHDERFAFSPAHCTTFPIG